MVTPEEIDELLETSANLAHAKDAARLVNTDPAEARPHSHHNAKTSGRSYLSHDRYSNDREQNDGRRSRRSQYMDVDFKDSSDPSSANGSVPNRRRSRSPTRIGQRHKSDTYPKSNTYSYRERDYDNSHRRPRRGAGDHWDGRSSNGSIIREDDIYRPIPGRHNDPSRDEEDYKHPTRDNRAGDRRDRPHHPREAPRNRSREPPKKRRTPTPTDDERDRRTIFVQQLANRAISKDLKKFFGRAGEVADAQIVVDRVSNRSKGVGYVEFKSEDSVPLAIKLTGQKLFGIPIIAQIAEAEKNRQVRNTEGAATQSNGVPFHRLYVGNIHFSITEKDLEDVFKPFGELEFVQLQKEEGGRSKGYGFVQFVDPSQAKEALEKMNGFELGNRPIRVGLGNDKFTPESTQSLLNRFGSQAHQSNAQGSAFSGMGGRGAHAGGTVNFDRAGGMDKTGGASALDDTDVAGVNFNNYSRDALMRKLARTDESESAVAPKAHVPLPVVNQPAPSRCVLLKNMYDQETQTEPNWQDELKADVRTECERQYGHVVHVGLALDNHEGEIFVKFEDKVGSQRAIQGLNGRFFGGKMINAQYVVEAVYHMNFPRAAAL